MNYDLEAYTHRAVFHDSIATCDLALYAVLCMQYEFSLNENFIILSPITLGGTRNETEKGLSSGSVRGVRGVSSTKIQVSVYCARTTNRNRIPAFYGEIRQVFSCF